MVKYILILNNDEFVVYEYYPEGKDSKGTITYDKKNDEFIVEKPTVYEHSYYLDDTYVSHVKQHILKFVENNDYKEKGMSAWM